MSVVLKEMWEAELLKKFRNESKDFLSSIPSKNQYVDNDVIHLHMIGDDPEVIVDNADYPIATTGRTDTHRTMALSKYETKNTSISDDELYAIPYDKESSVIRQHKETLEEKVLTHSLWRLAPDQSSTKNPVVSTTGAIKIDDIIEAKAKMDALHLPLMGRKIVLCSSHIKQLLQSESDKAYFAPLYHRIADGKIVNMFGFEVYENQSTVVYDGSNKKKAFEAAAAGTDRDASVFFFAPNAVKARGGAKMYYKSAKEDPEMRESKVGFRLYHICLPKNPIGFGAIVSA